MRVHLCNLKLKLLDFLLLFGLLLLHFVASISDLLQEFLILLERLHSHLVLDFDDLFEVG